MKTTVTESSFRDAFIRHDRADQFSHAGLSALFDYLTELEEDLAEEIELDVVELCCDYTEYADLKSYCEDRGIDYENDCPTIDHIEQDTTLIRVNCRGNGVLEDGSFIIADF